jgi:hypothetical protein
VEQRASRAVLRQAPDGPRLVLTPGGRKHTVDPKWAHEPALSQPVFLSFMTRTVRTAAARSRNAGGLSLHDVEHHDWGGTDWIVADADGNAVQVVEYDGPRTYGSQRRAANPSETAQ